ncbi:MAG: VWA domain-containing protein [bacterium]|nr:VWA domain-containing protein [bacterium]
MLIFAQPYFLLLLVIIPLLMYWYILKDRKYKGTVRFSNLQVFKKLQPSRKQKLQHSLFILRMLVITLIIIAIARPRSSFQEEEIETEGIDIVIAMDVSSSMKAEDFKPANRLEAAKIVAKDFIAGRNNDRIGMVVFSGRSYTQAPLTLDYGILLSFLEEIHIGMIEDGTAIGMAIATCINRLRESLAKSKVVILLTDGRNNQGELDPITASQIAKTMDVKIYTVGMGKRGQAMYPVDHPVMGKYYVPMEVQIDENVLTQIADNTGGRYFRATDEKKLEEIFEEIGELEKTKIEVKEYTRYSELFAWFVIPGVFLFLLEILLANTYFRKIP